MAAILYQSSQILHACNYGFRHIRHLTPISTHCVGSKPPFIGEVMARHGLVLSRSHSSLDLTVGGDGHAQMVAHGHSERSLGLLLLHVSLQLEAAAGVKAV